MSPPAIAAGSTEIQVGTNYKSDPSFYAPLDWKENGVDLDNIKSGVKSLKVTEEIGKKDKNTPSYPEYLPVWDRSLHYEPYSELRDVFQPGLKADPAKPNLLGSGVKLSHLSPKFGTVIEGVQLSSLNDAGKNELALLTAERGVLVFRDQDFANLGPQGAVDYGKFFGPLHVHPASGHPQGFPELHIVYRGPEDRYFDLTCKTKDSHRRPTAVETTARLQSISSVAWHSDVTYEINPPSTTFLFILDLPSQDGVVTGGDTLFLSQVEAYNRLSPDFQAFLSTLSAVHSGYEQAADARVAGGHVRREPVSNIHPVVRVHPVTGQKSLFVNEQFTRYIVGFKKEESDAILKFLYDHLAKSADIHIRVKWERGTVVVWDNRITAHSALHDFDRSERRHAVRITPRAEKPIPVKQ